MSKRFGPQLALDRVTFEVRRGEVHALVGHNGSGKSTLVKVLAGIHRPEAGSQATVGGSRLPFGDPSQAREIGLRFVHQDLALVDSLSVIDNVILGGAYPTHRAARIDWPTARREVTALLEELGYDIGLGQSASGLTAAERTGVAIARALRGTSEAAVLVLDEPTAALPADAVQALHEVIGRVAKRLGVLYISHHLEEVFAIAERTTVLRDGQVVATRETDSLAEDELVELMVGRRVAIHGRRAVSRTPGKPVLKATDLAAGALRGLDLELAAGEIVGVAGVAGSGRDDVAPALFGSRRRSGAVVVDDTVLPPNRPDKSIAAGLGLLAADRAKTGLVPHFSVSENLTLPRLEAGTGGLYLSHRREAREAMEWLDLVQLQPRLPHKPIGQLSGGNQQKVLIARWLRALPRVLIVDQPTEGVDIGTVEQIYAVIRSHAEAGTTFLVCSSDSEELVALCDRVLILNRGYLSAELRRSEIERDTIDSLCLASGDREGRAA